MITGELGACFWCLFFSNGGLWTWFIVPEVFLNCTLWSPHMCKLSRSTTPSCRLMKPKRHVVWPSSTHINKSDLKPHLASSQLIKSSLSLSDWIVQVAGNLFISHVQISGGSLTGPWLSFLAKIDQRWLRLSWPNLTVIFGRIFIFDHAALTGTKTEDFWALWLALITGLFDCRADFNLTKFDCCFAYCFGMNLTNMEAQIWLGLIELQVDCLLLCWPLLNFWLGLFDCCWLEAE